VPATLNADPVQLDAELQPPSPDHTEDTSITAKED
jgi:hypothetical protein